MSWEKYLELGLEYQGCTDVSAGALGSGITKSMSISCRMPNPSQVGHAP